MDEQHNVIKGKKEIDKYKQSELPYRYCKECYDYLIWENKTYNNVNN